MDLYTWGEDGELTGFQLTYDKPHAEKVFGWKKSKGFLHAGIDDGFRAGHHKGTPILVTDSVFEFWRVMEEFQSRAADLEATVVELVVDHIKRYAQ